MQMADEPSFVCVLPPCHIVECVWRNPQAVAANTKNGDKNMKRRWLTSTTNFTCPQKSFVCWLEVLAGDAGAAKAILVNRFRYRGRIFLELLSDEPWIRMYKLQRVCCEC